MGFWIRSIATGVVAIAGAVGALAQVPSPSSVTAHAPSSSAGAAQGVRIEGFDVEEVPSLAPGTRLAFTLFGTPGAQGAVRIEGAEGVLRLHETLPGIYDGVYTVGPRERLDPSAAVMGSLSVGDQVARARLEEPLVLAAAAPLGSEPPRVALTPSVADLAPPTVALPPPTAVLTPPAVAVTPPMVARASPDSLESPAYASPRNVLPTPFSRPRAVAPPAAASPSPSPSFACRDCAVVESVEATRPPPRAGVVGALIGGVTGALLGDRIADRAQRHWARVVGAIGGALAGRAIERQAEGAVRYDVWLRLPDGTRQVRSYPNPPPYRSGDVVRLPPVALVSLGRTALRD